MCVCGGTYVMHARMRVAQSPQADKPLSFLIGLSAWMRHSRIDNAERWAVACWAGSLTTEWTWACNTKVKEGHTARLRATGYGIIMSTALGTYLGTVGSLYYSMITSYTRRLWSSIESWNGETNCGYTGRWVLTARWWRRSNV